ncbi:glycosyltransferase family 2 protein [Microbacterium caowuchunii]|uniref:glycosyltransferase n=1 Tax=Microbacterium caowuchunii TaxID=2614638 RepID=UPI001247DA38|nr:glycosyltransferase [Microbacterium caowuchunii]QEW00602.1 glycosyltransferase family 2 protein [Microbacterium caowuchunii]
MPARVHALLVVRPEGRASAATHLARTLDALAAQTRPADVLTIVLCGAGPAVTELAAASGAEGIITASGATTFADAVRLAGPRLTGDAIWLLAQDTAPEPHALGRLLAGLERAPSVAIVAPKLVDADDASRIVSLGVTMTPLGRTVGLADDELDQGQHDADEDVLGADIRGILIRAGVWRELEGIDPALGGADEGLDLGVRARLAGHRVSLVPTAHVAVDGDGAAGLPAPTTRRRRRRRAYATRLAQLHRRLAYAPAAAVPLHLLSLIPLALWRAATLLVVKQPARVLPEWGASIVAFFRWGAIARSRRVIRRSRTASWHQLASLRITRTDLRQRFDADVDADAMDRPIREELRFFTGGGAWLVLAALLVSVVAFPSLLAWPVLGGGALEPLRATWGQLWADAAYGARSVGLDTVGPADPFAALIAVVGSLWPGDPSRALVLLWIAALPLAVLGAWFAASRVTSNSLLRNTAAVAWALAPTFWTALVDGRAGAVIVHLLLPWLIYAGAVAHRSWAAAGAASLLLAGVLAAAPSLAPALVILWALVVMLVLVARAGHGVGHIVWLGVPSLALFAPLLWVQVRAGNIWGLLADPGPVWAGPQATADAAGRLALAGGFPTTDLAGWTTLLSGTTLSSLAPWVLVLVAPLCALALLSLLTPRWMVSAILLVIALLGIGTAFAAVGIAVVSSTSAEPVPLWPGSGLSLAWLGVVGAAVIALDAGLPIRLRGLRAVGAAVVIGTLLVVAVPSVTAMMRDASMLRNGPSSTLPAYVAAQGRDDLSVGTILITPLDSGAAAARVVWGGSETIAGQSTVAETRTVPDAQDEEVAELTADLVTATSDDIVSRVAAHGIRFIVLAPASDSETDAARALRLSAETALDQRDQLDTVGVTPKGTLWRVSADVADRPGPSAADRQLAVLIALIQLVVVAAALLLSVPTASSRRQARRMPRTVGPRAREEER